LLLLAEGLSLRRIRAWKQNWQEKGLDGLLDAPRRGRPKKLTAAREASILTATEQPPSGAVCCSNMNLSP
jgi:transposase